MTDPRLPARNAAIIVVAAITLAAFIAWQLVTHLLRHRMAELEWWIAGFWLAAFDAMVLMVMVLR